MKEEEEKHVATVHTKCSVCGLSYQKPVTAKELMSGGGIKLIVCELCGNRNLKWLGHFVISSYI